MSIKLINTNELIDYKRENTLSSLAKIFFLLAILLFLPQTILSFLFGVVFGFWQEEGFTTNAFKAWSMSISVLLTVSLLSPLLTIPLLIKVTKAEDWSERFDFWAVKVMCVSKVAKWLAVGVAFWLFSSYTGELLKLPEEQIMLDIKIARNSVGMGILIFTTICLVVPIMEELVFRGWLFSKVAQTKLGSTGAIVLTSLIFTIIHSQYEQSITFIMLFLFSLLLGYARYKSNNISYSILIHIIFNSLALILLFSQP